MNAHPPGTDTIVTWRSLPRDDRRFALLLGAALVVITAIPYLYGWFRTPPGSTFTGIHALTGGDNHVYYSYIEQVRDGHLTFLDLFTAEPHARTVVQPIWMVIGLIARAFGLTAPVAYHVVRLLSIIPFVGFLMVFVATFLRHPIGDWQPRTLRRVALIIAVFGAGLGGLVGGALLETANDFPGYSTWPLDLWVPEAFPFLTLYHSPHLIISTWLLLATYLAVTRYDQLPQTRILAGGMITAALLATIHPFYIPLIPTIAAAIAAARMIAARRWIPHLAFATIAIGIAELPAFSYWGTITLLDPIHRSIATQNTLFLPPLPYVLIGYGFVAPLAIVGAALLVRSRHHRPLTASSLALLAWFVVNTALAWAPFPWQRRLLQGLFVALALLATVTLATVVTWVRNHLRPSWRSVFLTRLTGAILFVPLLAFSNLVNIGRDLLYYTIRFPRVDYPNGEGAYRQFMFYYSSAAIDAMRWLRNHTPEDAVVLTSGLTANFLPGWAARPVVIGHGIATIRFQEKALAYAAFLREETAIPDRQAFLASQRVQYIVVPTFDAATVNRNFRKAVEALRLPVAFENTAATIYAVRAPAT